MSRKPKGSKPLTTDPVFEFVDGATMRGAALDTGNSRAANRQDARLRKAGIRLRGLGPDGHRSLLGLLGHPSAWVRMSAAFDCLDIAEERAVEVLEEVARLPSFV